MLWHETKTTFTLFKLGLLAKEIKKVNSMFSFCVPDFTMMMWRLVWYEEGKRVAHLAFSTSIIKGFTNDIVHSFDLY